MSETTASAKISRSILALLLVCGMLITPTVGVAAASSNGSGGGFLPSVEISDKEVDGSGGEMPSEGEAIPGDMADEGKEPPAAEEPVEKEEPRENGDEAHEAQDSTSGVEDPNGTDEVSKTDEEDGEEPAELEADLLAGETAAVLLGNGDVDITVGANTLTISGGVQGVDFELDGSNTIIRILKSTPLTLRGTFAGSIQVNAGVKAYLTLSGVTITARSASSPINLMTSSQAHITLADGTTNTLDATSQSCAALHVGNGSELYIDDSVVNYAGRSHIEVLNGVVNTAGTLANGTVVKVGDPLTKVNSDDPGKLIAKGGKSSAAIGAGPAENAGNMIFDGGYIEAISWGGLNAAKTNVGAGAKQENTSADSSGSGIGAGGAGGATDMTFNSAEVHAYGSYHGAGIGAGWSSKGSAGQQTGAASGSANGLCGNININGGYLTSQGYEHGNAFGAACGTNATGKTIRVTGGTLLPSSYTGKYDLGGSGGWVVVTGGSLRVAAMNKFQGNAYNADDHKTLLTMVTIDLSSEGLANNNITSWRLLVDRMPEVYGAPSMLDNGQLYLWLPDSYKGKDISVELSYRVWNEEKGRYDELKLEPLYVEDLGGANSGSSLKRYIDISAAKEGLSPEAKAVIDNYFKGLGKYYDGKELEKIDLAKHPISTQGIEANPKTLDSNDKVAMSYQTLDEQGTIVSAGSTMPSETGTHSIAIVSKQYAESTGSYWGHRIMGNAEILPVNSQSAYGSASVTKPDGVSETITEPTWLQDDGSNLNQATNNHLFVPVDITSFTIPDGSGAMSSVDCKAPYGKLQLYIDGVAVPERCGGVINYTPDAATPGAMTDSRVRITKDKNGREHAMALFDLSRAQLEVFRLKDTGDAPHTVYVTYTSRRDGAYTGFAPQGATTFARVANGVTEGAQGRAAAGDNTSSAYRNYYDSRTDEAPVTILKSDCKFGIYNEDGTGYDPTNSATATRLKLDEAHKAQDVYYTLNPSDSDATAKKTTVGTRIPFYIDTNSVGRVTIASSNPGVLSFDPAVVPNRISMFDEANPSAENFGCGSWATVNGPGKTTVTVSIESTGAFKGSEYSFTVYVYPDWSTKPVIKLTEWAHNVTRSDGTVRPNDTLRYTTVFTNTTANSVLQGPAFTLTVPTDGIFKGLSVTTPQGKTQQLKEGADYTRQQAPVFTRALSSAFVLFGNERAAVADTITVSKPLTDLYGGQSYRFTMDVQVRPDAAAKSMGDLEFRSDSKGSGVYGIDLAHGENYPWDTRYDYTTGMAVDDATAFADPLFGEKDPATPPVTSVKPDVDDVLGGTLSGPHTVDPTVTPDGEERTGVLVGPVTPGSPLAEAEELGDEPDDPTTPDDRTPWPVKEGDVIISFGGDDDPTTPGDIQKELDRIIRDTLSDNPDATEVEIPVTVLTPDPDDPDVLIEKEVIVTVPVEDPMRPDDRDLMIIPDDVDPRADIETTKAVQNITPGFEKRGNKGIALLGDTLRYTVTISNTRVGSMWYNALVRDPLPEGISYIPGTAVVVDAAGQKHTGFDADYDGESRIIGFCVGDIGGGQSASVSFDCKVDLTAPELSVPENIAYAFGDEPSEYVKPDPDDPTGPVVLDRDEPIPAGPYDPEGDGKTWEDIEREQIDEIRDIYGVPENEPIALPESEKASVGDIAPADPDLSQIVTTKHAANLRERAGGKVYVGDTLRYTLEVANNNPAHTAWFDVVISDALPKGLAPVKGSLKLTMPDGAETVCSDGCYSASEGNVNVYVGTLRGGQKASLVLDVTVEGAAEGTDIGNTAYAYGSKPSDTDTSVIEGKPGVRPAPGERFELGGTDWYPALSAEMRSASKVAYPENYAGKVEPNPDDPLRRLAQTGDNAVPYAFALSLLAGAALIVLEASRRREAVPRGAHVRAYPTAVTHRRRPGHAARRTVRVVHRRRR